MQELLAYPETVKASLTTKGCLCLLQMGRFELADESTLFLDEIGELPFELQTKLLRVLQDGRFERLGSAKTIEVDMRVIAATNSDLAAAVENGMFREDLFYRLNVFPVHVPPLRERREDVLALAWEFIKEFGTKMGKPVERISREAERALLAYDWPGNIRELRNVIERAMILAHNSILEVSLDSARPPISKPRLRKSRTPTLAESERDYILQVLKQTKWRIRGPGGAAELLDVKPTTLESRMKKLGLRRPGSNIS